MREATDGPSSSHPLQQLASIEPDILKHVDAYTSEDNRDVMDEIEHHEGNSELEKEAPCFQQPISTSGVYTSGSNFACFN